MLCCVVLLRCVAHLGDVVVVVIVVCYHLVNIAVGSAPDPLDELKVLLRVAAREVQTRGHGCGFVCVSSSAACVARTPGLAAETPRAETRTETLHNASAAPRTQHVRRCALRMRTALRLLRCISPCASPRGPLSRLAISFA